MAAMHTVDQPTIASSVKIIRGTKVRAWAKTYPPVTLTGGNVRPQVRGKFLYVGDEKLLIRGVTYGPFRPDGEGNYYHRQEVIERDFAQMAAHGINVIRTYTPPPHSLLDVAHEHGLYVMAGLAADQYVGFLTDTREAPDIAKVIRSQVRACAGHPALLCCAIGNEIPASSVRWLGHRRVERFLESMYRAIKSEDPGCLVTYVNYPSTEYLQLPFLDLMCFNVFLEARDRLEAYLQRLQNLAGDRPVILSEIGLDSLRHGEDAQASALDWQVRATFAAGCAGAIVFAWTDEWFSGGARGTDVDDWKFGLTDRERRPKPALAAVRQAFAEAPFPPGVSWPRISVVICSYNGARTIRECLAALQRLDYPDFEVIVVDDGSTDRTGAIAAEFGVRLISTQNNGLSCARNRGLEASTGEVVAYLDDDAFPDPHWLTYLAATFLSTTHVGVGGPNIAPAGDGPIADSVANAPGNPTHVLLTDQEAEHIPGCNMAFLKTCLQAVGGFDPQLRVAGDDVDVCWRLQQCGWTLGFSPAAVVWHHRRDSLRGYWKQQHGYGKAEALLENKWPEKYNIGGHHTWAGRVYGKGFARRVGRAGHIYQGIWGSAPFQSLYEPAPNVLWSLALMPEWYLGILAFAALSALGLQWNPLLWALVPLILAIAALCTQAILGAVRASFPGISRSHPVSLKLRSLTALLYLLQPLARLSGRLTGGLSPWRTWLDSATAFPRQRSAAIWTEQWQAADQRLHDIETTLRRLGARVWRGGDYDRWDLEVRAGTLGASRVLMGIEEPGGGAQVVRLRSWPRSSRLGAALALSFATLSILAALDHAWVTVLILGMIVLLLIIATLYECAAATTVIQRALAHCGYADVVIPADVRPRSQTEEAAESAVP